MIYCGYCNNLFDEYQMLEYIAKPNHYAKCCPKCGICEYENGANFKGNMKKYIVVFYNRFACQTQTFSVIAENRFRAGRMFYRKHDRKIYFDCIEAIDEV